MSVPVQGEGGRARPGGPTPTPLVDTPWPRDHSAPRRTIPVIGRRDPMDHPVRLAKASGHGSNSSAEKVRPDTTPDPLVMASGERVTDADRWYQARRPEISCPRSGTIALMVNGPGPGCTTGTD